MRRFLIVTLLLLAVLPLTSLGAQENYIQHVVRPGENLFRISLQYRVSISSILTANPSITNRNLIYAGTTLRIPQTPPTPVAPTATATDAASPTEELTAEPGQPTATSAPSATPVPTATPVPSLTPAPAGEQEYRVVWGDTLGIIARRFGTTVSAIARRNGIVNPNLIYRGQLLIIPVPGSSPIQPTATTVPGQPSATPTSQPTATGTQTPTVTITPTLEDTGPVMSGFELGGQVFGFQYAQQMQDAGMTWVKRQVVWNAGDAASGVQGIITEAHDRGFKILLSIKGNKEQFGDNPTQYYQQFAGFLADVAELGPDAIEVWNEQNIDREWPAGEINPQAYTQMLATAYNAIKNRNNEVFVISGAPAPTGFFEGECTGAGCDDQPYLEGMKSAGAATFMDCVGIHYNEGVLSPDATSDDPRENPDHYTRYYGTMVDTYRAIFPDTPLCFTELGYLSPEGYGPLPDAFSWADDVTVQDQAAWLARAVTLARDSGFIPLLIVWNVDATEYGADPQAGYAIIRPDGQSVTCLACDALATAMGMAE
ncbi:MAG: hypothetical protein CL610_21085 [Anaerolineaceae bacterium]|nr:hypothetical protein [Anaerolineaceae bacterium]